MDCFAEFIIGRRVAPTRWLAMTIPLLGTIRNKSRVLKPFLQVSGDCA
jgi:hypothetical protein